MLISYLLSAKWEYQQDTTYRDIMKKSSLDNMSEIRLSTEKYLNIGKNKGFSFDILYPLTENISKIVHIKNIKFQVDENDWIKILGINTFNMASCHSFDPNSKDNINPMFKKLLNQMKKGKVMRVTSNINGEEFTAIFYLDNFNEIFEKLENKFLEI